MKKRKFIYVVQEITVTEYDIVGGVIVGAYDSSSKARQAIKAHRQKNRDKHKSKNKHHDDDHHHHPHNSKKKTIIV